MAPPRGGLEDRARIGVELGIGVPLRAEAIGHLAEDDAGTEHLLRAVVGRRQPPAGDEDEQVLPEIPDDSEQFPSRPVDGRAAIADGNKRQAFPGEIVHDGQDAEPPAIGESIRQEVPGPSAG
jgi:hypothetical protein